MQYFWYSPWGIGIGLCGGLGLAILTLGFGLPMGSPPVDVILIIMTVVVAASALQAAGGMDYLVRVAGNFMRRNPKYINIIAPIITVYDHYGRYWVYCFSTLPVIAEVAKESGIRPSRTLAGSVVASQVAISGSPISAAMAAMLTIMEVNGVSFIQVMSVCLPTSFAAAMVAAFIASRQGCELQDDEVYLERLQKDWCKNTRIIAASSGATLSVGLFLLATVAIVILAAFPNCVRVLISVNRWKHAISLLSVCSLPPA